MRAIPSALQTKLDSGVTTLCCCWIVRRHDGVVQGFSDHDDDIVFSGVTCVAGSGIAGSEVSQELGLAVQGSEISGALSDDELSEADLAAGRYDAAAVEAYIVDWTDPTLFVLISKGVLGEVRREGIAFTAELRSLTNRLAEDSGRLYTATCSADLGDARCTVDLTDPALHGSGTVSALDGGSIFRATGLDGFADGWFTAGKVTFASGANTGLASEVKVHRVETDGVHIELWQQMPEAIAPGDTFAITAGCDKRFATCRDRFANAVDFRGFPQIPGNDFVFSYPIPGEPGNDGTSFVGVS
jgi:uncharacterized phage protein (TIGR02218 family)